MWLADLEALRPELDRWNAANRLARDSYAAEPFAGTRALNDNDKARDRMAASRAEKRQKK